MAYSTLVRKGRMEEVLLRVLGISLCWAILPILLFSLAAPVLIFFFPQIMQHLFFLNFRRMPLTDYENVTSNGVNAAGRVFYLNGDEGRIGSWHMAPQSQTEEAAGWSEEEWEASLADPLHPVILYAHGNSFDRTINHRCELYNVLTRAGFHVIAFDYRGYGDSEGSPTEEGIVNDTRMVYEYLQKHTGKNAVIVWGHSMGTGVSTRMVKELSSVASAPAGLVLESPFNNLRDAVMHHPFSLPIRWLPSSLVDKLLLNPLRGVGLLMESDQRITHITCPILILHAADDHVIPVKLGRRLHAAAKNAQRNVEYVEFESSRGFAHKFIYMAEELPELVVNFVTKCQKKA